MRHLRLNPGLCVELRNLKAATGSVSQRRQCAFNEANERKIDFALDAADRPRRSLHCGRYGLKPDLFKNFPIIFRGGERHTKSSERSLPERPVFEGLLVNAFKTRRYGFYTMLAPQALGDDV